MVKNSKKKANNSKQIQDDAIQVKCNNEEKENETNSNQDLKNQKEEEYYGPLPLIQLQLHFEPITVYRRSSLGLLPNVQDPEFDKEMRLSQLKSSKDITFVDENTVTNGGGYKLCRGTRELIGNDKYYWEVDFHKTNDKNSHIRIGIATKKADTEAPVGYDEYGYSIRDIGGKFHNSRKQENDGFSSGDTVGFGFYLEDEGYALKYFINGNDKGLLFEKIDKDEKWIPAISTFRNAKVTARFKRLFKYEPGEEWKSAYDCPKTIPTELFTADKLIEVMYTTLNPYDAHEKDYLAAIDTALIPPNLMQC